MNNTFAASLADLHTAQTYPVDLGQDRSPQFLLPLTHQAPSTQTDWYKAVISKPEVMDRWSLGERSWHYSGDEGLEVSLGSTEVNTALALGRKMSLGGVHILQHGWMPGTDARDWSVSLALGALDYATDPASGDLSYGPAAASTVVHYDLGANVSLEGGAQVMPGLVTTSLGGRYDTMQWGQFYTAVAHGRHDKQEGVRVQAAYNVDVGDVVRLSVNNEWSRAGFTDLGQYRAGGVAGMRQQWAATLPTRAWGEIRGTYESFTPADGLPTQHFGFNQQFWYSPNLRIGLQARHAIAAGDYDIGIRFSVPIH